MDHPPYHLRPNKAVDRGIFLDLIDNIAPIVDINGFKYIGMGGPFLEDFRLILKKHKAMKGISLERNYHTHKRQIRHKSSSNISFEKTSTRDYINHHFQDGQKSIVWLDYTNMQTSQFSELMDLLELAGENTIVKITLNISSARKSISEVVNTLRELAESTPIALTGGTVDDSELRDWILNQYVSNFNYEYNDFISATPLTSTDLNQMNMPRTVLKMLHRASEKSFPAKSPFNWEVLHSCSYIDGVHQMLSVTGIVTSDSKYIRKQLSSWPHLTKWSDKPPVINLPELSIKERLLLEKYLPGGDRSANRMSRTLGYDVGTKSLEKLKQYKSYYQYLPSFTKMGF